MVGTVIDPEMSDELRVTVVVTGIGNYAGVVAESTPHTNVVKNIKSDGTLDYNQLDRPTYMRNEQAKKVVIVDDGQKNRDIDYLDIPAFLRKQEEER